jgi:hypothetical protein
MPSHWIIIIYCGILGGGMFTIVCIFFRSSSFLSLETIKPKIIPENTINAHLSRFKLMPYFLHFWKHNLSFYKWLSMLLYIIKSSWNIFIKLSEYFLNALVITFWYVGGPFSLQTISPPYKSPLVYKKCNFVYVL